MHSQYVDLPDTDGSTGHRSPQEEPPDLFADIDARADLSAARDDPFANPDTSPLLLNLNAEQHQAVVLPNQHALILAGAGSGKTRVLTTRIAWLLQTGQITPGGVLSVTFTNKAAKEMLTRLSSMLPVNVRGMWIGTFHGLCNRFLRAHFKLANLPQSFQILDTQDQLSSIKRIMKAANVDEDRCPAKELMWFINACKEDGERAAHVKTRDGDSARKVELYALYEAQCQREGVVDFAELMLRSYELMRDNTAIREHYQARFRHLLVDEFQDTNKLQYAWLKLFGGGANQTVFAVGDDDQSIYAFRGAQVGNMADFVREFGVRHQIKLERNYRSHGNILNSANALIANNKRRLGKNLSTDQGLGEPVRLYEATSDLAEAQWLVEEAQALMSSGTRKSEVACLYRSNAQSRVLETSLFNAGIPYKVYGGLRFFERAEIKHALAYLRLAENVSDDTSFLRVVNFPPRGIGARSIEQLQDAARTAGCSLAAACTLISGKAGTNISAFVAMIDVLREQSDGLTLREIIELVLDKSRLVEHYKSEKDGQDRVENLEELVNAAESFATIEGFGRDAPALAGDAANTLDTRIGLTQSPASQGLTDAPIRAALDEAAAPQLAPDAETGEIMSPLLAFLTHAALEAGDNQAQAGQEAVQLMTIHAAKGLEFDCVFLSGLEEGLFPNERALADWDGLEEERRLMYVAITRARKRLYLSHSQTRMLHGQTRYNIKSRFLDELPEEALKSITPKRSASMGGGFGAGYSGGRFAGNSGSRFGATGDDGYAFKIRASDQANTGTTGQFEPKVAQKSTPQGLKPGTRVFHAKFGEGKVLTVDGHGDDARAQVSFTRHGTKWLALSVAKLDVVS